MIKTANKKIINGWAMYDWANSVYNLVITTTFFPVLYNALSKAAPHNGTITFMGRQFAAVPFKDYCMAASFMVVVIMIPILSSIADSRGSKKKFMFLFCTLGSICCSALFFFNTNNILLSLLLFCVATIGFYGSQVFYNSYLPEIAAVKDQDRISAKGYTYGYIGSVILQLVGFGLVVYYGDSNKLFPLQLTFLLVGLWWFGFAQITFNRLPATSPAVAKPSNNILTDGWHELNKVIKQLRHMPTLKRYLISFFLYSTGVQTIMLAASDFGLTELMLPDSILIFTIVIIQLVAILGAITMAKISSKIGNINTLLITVAMWVLICISGYLLGQKALLLKPYAIQIEAQQKKLTTLTDTVQIAQIKQQIITIENDMKPLQQPITYLFYLLAAAVGIVMGGIQALSRATYAKLMPPDTKDTASFFSFYDVTEKLSIVVGIFSFGYIHERTGSMSQSILALIVFFVLGFGCLWFTKLAAKKQLIT